MALLSANGVSFDFKGDAAMKRRLLTLEKKVRTKVARNAMKAGVKPITAAMKSKAPVDTGALRQSIGSKIKVYRSGTAIGVIGPRVKFKASKRVAAKMVGSKANRRPANYAHLVEFGTTGAAAKPFLRPAFDANKRSSQDIIRRETWRGITEAVR